MGSSTPSLPADLLAHQLLESPRTKIEMSEVYSILINMEKKAKITPEGYPKCLPCLQGLNIFLLCGEEKQKICWLKNVTRAVPKFEAWTRKNSVSSTEYFTKSQSNFDVAFSDNFSSRQNFPKSIFCGKQKSAESRTMKTYRTRKKGQLETTKAKQDYMEAKESFELRCFRNAAASKEVLFECNSSDE